ncbi:MAG: phosphatidylserine decarboxylase [Clostridiales bacterium]
MKIRKNLLAKIKAQTLLSLCLIMVLCATACSNTTEPEAPTKEHQAITESLINIMEENPEVEKLLIKSIDKAKEINPNKETNPAQSIEEYYEYIDWAATAMPWNISQNLPDPKLYEQIDQSLNYFYFINDRPLEELDGKGLYNNSLQYAEPYRSWLIDFTKEWGKFLDTKKSWNEEFYKLAYDDERFGLQGDLYEDPKNWQTFNEFFARYLSSPDKRPIAAAADPKILVSPADSVPQGVWNIDGDSHIVHKDGITVKSKEFTSISDLIGKESEYKDQFANGVLTHTFLDVHDYHRYHFPVDGVIKEVKIIPQDDAVGGYVEWDAKTEKYVLNAATPGWQMIETRGCVIMETEKYGLVALLPIGMSQVSSVNFEDNVKPGTAVKKGDMLGNFLFGGSDYVMIFQNAAGFEITAPKENGSEKYKHIDMGAEYGQFTAE